MKMLVELGWWYPSAHCHRLETSPPRISDETSKKRPRSKARTENQKEKKKKTFFSKRKSKWSEKITRNPGKLPMFLLILYQQIIWNDESSYETGSSRCAELLQLGSYLNSYFQFSRNQHNFQCFFFQTNNTILVVLYQKTNWNDESSYEIGS